MRCYSAWQESQLFPASAPERVETFRRRILRSGIVATTRKTRGSEIAAACGQLVGKVHDRGRRAVGGQSIIAATAP